MGFFGDLAKGAPGGPISMATNVWTSHIDKDKNYDDLSWYDKAALKVSSKFEGLENNVANVFGFDNPFGTGKQDLLNRLKQKREDSAGTSLNTGGAVTGAGGGGGGMPGMQIGGTGGEGETLGRKAAVQEEPALQEPNYNLNNYSF